MMMDNNTASSTPQGCTPTRVLGETGAVCIKSSALSSQDFWSCLGTMWSSKLEPCSRKMSTPNPQERSEKFGSRKGTGECRQLRIAQALANGKDVKVVKQRKQKLDDMLMCSPKHKLITGNVRNKKHEIKKLCVQLLQHVKLMDQDEQKLAMGLVMKFVFLTRDCRKENSGQGNRYESRRIFMYLYRHFHSGYCLENLHLFKQFGYWKDLFSIAADLTDPGFQGAKQDDVENRNKIIDTVVTLCSQQLIADSKIVDDGGKGISLLAKWLPRPKSALDKKLGIFKKISHQWVQDTAASKGTKKNGRKEFRHLITKLNHNLKTTEIYMHKNEFDKIDFKNVAGRCLNRNRKIFLNEKEEGGDVSRKMCLENMKSFLEKCKEGKASAKGTSLTPPTLVNQVSKANPENKDEIALLQAQWNDIVENLRKHIVETERKKAKESDAGLPTTFDMSSGICLADVSGSMSGAPMDLSVSLAMLISSLQKGPWKDKFITFAGMPEFVDISDVTHSIKDCVQKVLQAPWGDNTDYLAAFSLILDVAKELKLEQEDLPSYIVTISDMQFDEARCNDFVHSRYNDFLVRAIVEKTPATTAPPQNVWGTQLEIISRAFEIAGEEITGKKYKMPAMVFWNARSTGNSPATFDEKGVVLLSGDSANLIKSFMMGEDLTKLTGNEILQRSLDDKVYDCVMEPTDEQLRNWRQEKLTIPS